jgi:hypothetical protein
LALGAGSNTASAYSGPNTYGIEMRGGFGVYDMGDVPQVVGYMNRTGVATTTTNADNGPMGGFSLLFRPARHQLWEVGFNAILDVESTVDSAIPDTNGSVLMHANEFFLKANVVPWIGDRLSANLGLGLSYYNVELQIQDDFNRRYVYDADGRAWGLLATAGLEYFLADRLGLSVQGGVRVANATYFSYESNGVRSGLNVSPSNPRPAEVNLTGAYGSVGLRFYFDKVFPPIDFGR